jgi:hypothetical protein
MALIVAEAERMRIGSIVIQCQNFDRMVTFWQVALGYVVREPASADWVVLRDPRNGGPNLSFQARQRERRCRSWLHIDLYTSRQQEEVERLVSIGAARCEWRYPPEADYVVLADPDGNLFCVVQKVDIDAADRRTSD